MLGDSSFNLQTPIALVMAFFQIDILAKYVNGLGINQQFYLLFWWDILFGLYSLLMLLRSYPFVFLELPLKYS